MAKCGYKKKCCYKIAVHIARRDNRTLMHHLADDALHVHILAHGARALHALLLRDGDGVAAVGSKGVGPEVLGAGVGGAEGGWSGGEGGCDGGWG